MKHQQWELKQMQSLPLEIKVRMTQRRVAEWYDYWDGEVYLSFSGGKDSTVLKHIIDQMYDDVPSVFVNTGLEYPEIRKFAINHKNVVVVTPKMNFKDVLKTYGYPVISKEVAKCVYYARKSGEDNVHYKKLFGTLQHNGEKSRYCCDKYSYLYDAPFKISERCCSIMKKEPAHKYERKTGKKPIIATMAEESLLREQAWKKSGCNAFDAKSPRSMPMAFWTEQDVLHYLNKYNVPYCSVYGKIQIQSDPEEIDGQINIADYLGIRSNDLLEMSEVDRTGCVFCMFGCHLEKEPNRFQRLKKTHPKQYDYCISGGHYVDGVWQPSREGLGLSKVLDYIGVKY